MTSILAIGYTAESSILRIQLFERKNRMKTGLIGLGAMGMPMALNLHRCGYLHTFWNRSPQKRESLTEKTGIQAANDIKSVATQCELVILSVSADEDVLEVVDQLAESMQQDNIVIDTSTVSVATAQEAATRLSKNDIHFLDAPVSGGVEGAIKGSLSMMVGGDKSILEHIWTVLECLSSRIVHMGPVGNGQATKAVNQI
ncbi:MAG: NAD(P)-dependent oxidoreductase, partial [Gammaproteobacteria bacterium]